MYAYIDLNTKIYYSDTKDTVGDEVRIWEYGDYDLIRLKKFIGEKKGFSRIYKYEYEMLRENPNRPKKSIWGQE